MTEGKPFCISKWAVLAAWHKVRANKGAAGVDDVSIEAFEWKLQDNLYRIWNRMSSGSYMPPPVRRVMIPKADGKQRPLGIPTVGDRVAQMVVKMELEPEVEHLFHPDSYGYRPKKSALDAVGTCRQRCWRYDWIVDLDIKGFDFLGYSFPPERPKTDGASCSPASFRPSARRRTPPSSRRSGIGTSTGWAI